VITGRAALRGQGIANSAPSVIDVLEPANRRRKSIAYARQERCGAQAAPGGAAAGRNDDTLDSPA